MTDDDDSNNSSQRRRFTVQELEEIAQAQADAKDRLADSERRARERALWIIWFGYESRPGKLADMESQLMKAKEEIEVLKTFRGKVLLLASIALPVVVLVGQLLGHLLDKLIWK